MHLNTTDKLLDMGTGGGEILLSIGHPHKNTCATESWLPNYELCMQKLAPLGITVARTYEDEKIPFNDEQFHVVTNRHESFDLNEVDRVLKPGGYFITQQVGAENYTEFAQRLNDDYRAQYPGHSLENYTQNLRDIGYHILASNEIKYTAKFHDVGALVFYAKIIEWEYPNFSVKTHLKKLFACQQELEEKGTLEGTEHRFFLVAQKGRD